MGCLNSTLNKASKSEVKDPLLNLNDDNFMSFDIENINSSSNSDTYIPPVMGSDKIELNIKNTINMKGKKELFEILESVSLIGY